MHWFLQDIRDNALDVWRVLRWILLAFAVVAVIQFGQTLLVVLGVLIYHLIN